MANLQALEHRLSHHDVEYQLHFAGRSRLTRDLSRMERLLAGAQAVLAEARQLTGVPAPQRAALVGKAEHQSGIYATERDAIAAAQREAGPAGRQAAVAAQRAHYVVHRYIRHFAGQSRSTRDVFLLLDLIACLEPLAAEMERLGAATMSSAQEELRWVQTHLAQFREERKAIAQASTDASPDEQVSVLAQIANGLFASYRTHFANQPRVTRRPELLARLIQSAEQVGDRMEALRLQGLQDANNEGNLDIVAQRLQAWRTELTAIRTERQRTSLTALVADLETAANAELESYAEHFAGQDRSSRDLGRLAAICDRLDEIERQLTRLDEVQEMPVLVARLATVRDALSLYQDEYDAIATAQRT